MAKIAYYHREGNPAHELVIVKTHEDKTVDLALDEKAAPIITGCAITKEPVFGSCTLAAPAAPAKAGDDEKLQDPVLDPSDKKKK